LEFFNFDNDIEIDFDLNLHLIPRLEFISMLFNNSDSESGSSESDNSDVSSIAPSLPSDGENPDNTNEPDDSEDGSEANTCMHGSDQYCSICTERTNMDRIIECEHI
jgi:hypothetical protein